MSKVPPCKRCKKSEPKDYGPGMGDNDEEDVSLLLGESDMAPGVLAWLCHGCRVEWRALCCGHDLFDRYVESQFRLNHWKVTHELSGEGNVEEGLEMLEGLGKLEMEMGKFATRFLGIDEEFG